MLHNHPPWLLQCILRRSFNKERFSKAPSDREVLLEYERIKIKSKFPCLPGWVCWGASGWEQEAALQHFTQMAREPLIISTVCN